MQGNMSQRHAPHRSTSHRLATQRNAYILKKQAMTPRQRSARINSLRKEYERLMLAGRTVTANKVAKELASLVVERMKYQLGRVS